MTNALTLILTDSQPPLDQWQLICQPTDDRDVGQYVKIACDLVHVTDQSGISALWMRLEKKFVQVMKIIDHTLHLQYLMGT